MAQKEDTPATIATHIRRALKDGGSAEHAAGVQWFFKEEIKSHGWRTAELRRAIRGCRKDILQEHDFDFLVKVADQLFSGPVLEEKVAAIFLLENLTDKCGDREFALFESWLDRVSSWADHDALVHDLISPMIAAKFARAKSVFKWGEVAESVASPRRLCGSDSRSASPDVVCGDHEARRPSAQRSGRYGAKRPGLAAAPSGEVRPQANGPLLDEDPKARSPACAAHGL